MDTVQLLKDSTAAVRVRFEWLGVRKTLSRNQIDQAATPFGAEGKMVSAAKRIMDTKHEAIKALNKVKADVVAYWKDSTLPYVEDGVRLLPRTQLQSFEAFMQQKKLELATAAHHVSADYDQIIKQAKTKLGALFNANDYPPNIADRFKLEWEYPPLDPPNYLAQADPEIYQQETERLKARFAEAGKLAEETFINEFANLTAHLADRLKPEADGTQKIFHASAIDNLRTFFDRFSKLNITGNQKIEELVEQAKKTVANITPKDIRDMEALRTEVRGSMEALTAQLDAMLVNKPKRKITQPKKQEPADEAAPALLSA